MANILLKASGPNIPYYVRSGTITSDQNGIISIPPYGPDLSDLVHQGCSPMPVGGSSAAPHVSSRIYGIPRGVTPASMLTVASTLYAYPIIIQTSMAVSAISMSSLTGQTGGKMRAALYSDNGNGYPGAIVPGTDTGDLAATATAVATKGSLTATLEPGLYWVATIFAATSTMPSVAGTGVSYAHELTSVLGSDTAAHALAVSGQAVSGISIAAQTYPATSMTVSFPTFPPGATLTLNAATPLAVFATA